VRRLAASLCVYCVYGVLQKMSNVKTLNRGGRKPGATNLKTREKAALQAAVARALADRAMSEDVAALSAADVLRNIMHMCYQSGDYAGARVAAAELIPFTHARVSPTAPDPVLPDDLRPDPPPTPDEPGPDRPVI
jgi:hypothetical protein